MRERKLTRHDIGREGFVSEVSLLAVVLVGISCLNIASSIFYLYSPLSPQLRMCKSVRTGECLIPTRSQPNPVSCLGLSVGPKPNPIQDLVGSGPWKIFLNQQVQRLGLFWVCTCSLTTTHGEKTEFPLAFKDNNDRKMRALHLSKNNII